MSDETDSFTFSTPPSLWLGLMKDENPEQVLTERVCSMMLYKGFKDEEVKAIRADPMFTQSVMEAYRSAMGRFHGWRHSVPSGIKVRWQKLGSSRKESAQKENK